jgi:hypothetical protein
VWAQRGAAFGFQATPEAVDALLAGLLHAVPDGAHRAALEACAQVRVTTEPLLAALLDVPDAGTLFDWLHGLSIMDSGPRGLQPHELARDALHHTYLQPAGSQQRAAELVDVPMTTFRRHLAAGVARLTELLWERELEG